MSTATAKRKYLGLLAMAFLFVPELCAIGSGVTNNSGFVLAVKGACGRNLSRESVTEVLQFNKDIADLIVGRTYDATAFAVPTSLVDYFSKKYSTRSKADFFLDLVRHELKSRSLDWGPLDPIEWQDQSVLIYDFWNSIFKRLSCRDKQALQALMTLLQLEFHATKGRFLEELLPAENAKHFGLWIVRTPLVDPEGSSVRTLIESPEINQVDNHAVELCFSGQSDFAKSLAAVRTSDVPLRMIPERERGSYSPIVLYLGTLTATDSNITHLILAQAIKERFLDSNDPIDTLSNAKLPKPEGIKSEEYWSVVINECAKLGAPTMIALLKSIPDPDQIPPDTQALILQLIEEMKKPAQ